MAKILEALIPRSSSQSALQMIGRLSTELLDTKIAAEFKSIPSFMGDRFGSSVQIAGDLTLVRSRLLTRCVLIGAAT